MNNTIWSTTIYFLTIHWWKGVMCLLNWHEITVCFSCFRCYFFIIEFIASLFILNTTSGYDTYLIFYCILIFPLMWAAFPCVFSISVLCTKADTSAVPVKCEYLVYCFITCLSRLQEKKMLWILAVHSCMEINYGDQFNLLLWDVTTVYLQYYDSCFVVFCCGWIVPVVPASFRVT